MEKLYKLEHLSLELILQAAAVRATDGCISELVWTNLDPATTHDQFIRVVEVTPEEAARVRHRIAELLGERST